MKKTKSRKSSKNKSRRSNKYKKLNCAPNPDSKQPFTCYTDNTLLKMKSLWNIRHPRDKIKGHEPKEIWDELKIKMGNSCDRESCWLRKNFMNGNLDKELLNYTFAPKMPSVWKNNPDEWLSSLEIESVMKQYEKYYKCFVFLGPSPIDFDSHKFFGECVWEELCKFNLANEIKMGKNKIGIILNTDPHNEEGEHWISLFINIKKRFIIYFDSNGDPAPKEVNTLIDRIKNQGRNLNIDFEVYKNTLEHQKTESECGMYCLYFIIGMLHDKQPEYFLKNRIKDEEVFKLRQKYFNYNEV